MQTVKTDLVIHYETRSDDLGNIGTAKTEEAKECCVDSLYYKTTIDPRSVIPFPCTWNDDAVILVNFFDTSVERILCFKGKWCHTEPDDNCGGLICVL